MVGSQGFLGSLGGDLESKQVGVLGPEGETVSHGGVGWGVRLEC